MTSEIAVLSSSDWTTKSSISACLAICHFFSYFVRAKWRFICKHTFKFIQVLFNKGVANSCAYFLQDPLDIFHGLLDYLLYSFRIALVRITGKLLPKRTIRKIYGILFNFIKRKPCILGFRSGSSLDVPAWPCACSSLWYLVGVYLTFCIGSDKAV